MCHASLSHTRVMRCVHLLLERCAHAGVEPGPHKQVAAEEGTHEAGDLAEAIDTLLNVLADGDDGGVAALAHAADDDAVVAGLVHFVSVEYNEKFDLGVCVCVCGMCPRVRVFLKCSPATSPAAAAPYRTANPPPALCCLRRTRRPS